MDEIVKHGIVSFPSFVHITENTSLSGDEKNLLNLILALSIKHGYSYATNDYLAKIIGKTEHATTIILSRLKANGLINIIDNSKKKRERKITLPNLEKFSQYTKKTLEALTPEPTEESLHVSVEEPPFVDKYAKFASPKKAPRITTIVNIGNVTLTPKMREYASKKDLNDQQTEEIFEKFISHHGSKGSKFENWDLAFNTWLLNANKYDKKNFSDTRAKTSTSSSSPTVGERIMMENMLLSEHPAIERIMMRKKIHIANVMMGYTSIPEELSNYALIEIRTPKEGVQMIWYDKSKYTKKDDDIITVDAIEHKG